MISVEIEVAMLYTARIYKDEDGYSVEFPDLGDTFTFGATPEEAKAMLVQAGLISEDLDLSAPLTEQGMCDLLAGMGVPMQTDTPDAGMTRGELADLLMMIFGGAQE